MGLAVGWRNFRAVQIFSGVLDIGARQDGEAAEDVGRQLSRLVRHETLQALPVPRDGLGGVDQEPIHLAQLIIQKDVRRPPLARVILNSP